MTGALLTSMVRTGCLQASDMTPLRMVWTCLQLSRGPRTCWICSNPPQAWIHLGWSLAWYWGGRGRTTCIGALFNPNRSPWTQIIQTVLYSSEEELNVKIKISPHLFQADTILGFNEPNHPSQDNMSPEETALEWVAIQVSVWPQKATPNWDSFYFQERFPDKTLVSPSAAPCGGNCNGGDTKWAKLKSLLLPSFAGIGSGVFSPTAQHWEGAEWIS